MFGTQSQSSRRSTSSWLNPARGAFLFAAKRLLGLAAVLLVISFGTFSLLTIAPGDPAQLLLGTRQQSPAVIHAVRHEYHLDRPFLVQYGIWLQHAIHFDFGRSIRTQDPVWSDISSRLGLSLFLGIYATLITVLVGVPLGVLAAVRQRTARRPRRRRVERRRRQRAGVRERRSSSSMFAVRSAGSPSSAPGTGVVDRLHHLALPAIALALTGWGSS